MNSHRPKRFRLERLQDKQCQVLSETMLHFYGMSTILLWVSVAVSCTSNFNKERPVWTWKCIGNTCMKLKLQNDKNPISPSVCKLLCDEYASIWPHPTGDIHFDRIMVDINLNRISVEASENIQSEPRTQTLVRGAAHIFKQQIIKLARLNEMATASGKSLFVLLNIGDPSVFRPTFGINEDYEMTVSETDLDKMTVVISAVTYFGARHGLETLNQLVIFDDVMGELLMPKHIHIMDGPAYPHRGIMLDTARSYFPVESIKKTIDGMAANKLNTFHWHLTDSQSFPFQSPTHPEFSHYGAYSPTKIYTFKDIWSIIEYGHVRGVRIIPEISGPAHVGEGWQWVDDNITVCFKAEPWRNYCIEPPCGQLNPTSDKMYKLLGDIYKDVLKVFVPDVFHMGGYEVNFGCWNTSDVIIKWMDKNNLNHNEDGFKELWRIFINRASAELVEANGGKELPVILWTSNEINSDSIYKHLDRNKYIFQTCAKGDDVAAAKLILEGFQVIFSNYDALCFDCGFGAWLGEEDNWYSPYISWQKVYENDPLMLLNKLNVNVDEGFPVRSLVLGSEAILFSEQVDETALDSRLWPRAAALAECLWSNPRNNSEAAEYRMLNHRERLVQRGLQAEPLKPAWCYQNEGHCPVRFESIQKAVANFEMKVRPFSHPMCLIIYQIIYAIITA